MWNVPYCYCLHFPNSNAGRHHFRWPLPSFCLYTCSYCLPTLKIWTSSCKSSLHSVRTCPLPVYIFLVQGPSICDLQIFFFCSLEIISHTYMEWMYPQKCIFTFWLIFWDSLCVAWAGLAHHVAWVFSCPNGSDAGIIGMCHQGQLEMAWGIVRGKLLSAIISQNWLFSVS